MVSMPLEGIRVLDWTVFQQGPTATALLADMGADVIKIEEPRGEPGRGLMRMYGEEMSRDIYFQNHNRGKRAIVLDVTKERGREVFCQLAAKSDVVVTSLRYRFVKKVKLDYESLSPLNPKLIYAVSCGYGLEGPDADLPSYDLAGQARGGLWSTSMSEDLKPVPIGGGFADEVGGLMTAYGILLALLARERTGVGQMVETSLLGSQIELGRLNLQYYFMTGHLGQYTSVLRQANSPLWNLYHCKDDKWISLAMIQADRFWPKFCEILGLQELEKDPRFANQEVRAQNIDEIMPRVREVFHTRTRDEWVQIFNQAELVASPVNNYADVAEDPQVKANDYVVEINDPVWGKIRVPGIPVKLSKTPGKITRLAPELGQHTEEVLMEVLGYTWDDITELREEEVF